MRTQSLLLLLALPASGCGSSSSDSATATAEILYGERARVGDFPSVGHVPAFEDGRTAGPLCTASLIAPDTVLTAAHCLEDAQPDFEVFFARELTAFPILSLRNERWSAARRWVLHPDYVSASDGHIAHDVALIFLDAPVTDVELPAIADARIAPYLEVGAPVHIVGYGRDETGWSGPLRRAKSFVSYVGDEVIRTGGTAPTPSRCSGDSGGPTFMDVPDGLAPTRRLISVNSYGFQTCDSASTEARVDAYLDWIVRTMRAACDDGSRIDDCAQQPEPRLADRGPEPDAGVTDAPSVGAAPDAGTIEVSVRPPEGGCRCTRPEPGLGAGLVMLLLAPLCSRRRRA